MQLDIDSQNKFLFKIFQNFKKFWCLTGFIVMGVCAR